MELAFKYLQVLFLLVLVYLVVVNGDKTTTVLNALSRANTNAILALQGSPSARFS